MDEASRAQIRAAMPDRSSWVSANAGSGKTRVLTDRVARLLLTGTEPQKILCLTYTKAAAGEMQNRLFRTLGEWAMLSDDDLQAALAKLREEAEPLAPEALARARTLFARALETPGGLKIQTIHAFCESLLRRFPLEAGVSLQFRVLDEREAKELRRKLLDEIADARPDIFAAFAAQFTGTDVDDLLAEIARHADGIDPSDNLETLDALFDIPADLTLAEISAQTIRPGDLDALAAMAEFMTEFDAKLGNKAKAIRDLLAARPEDHLGLLIDMLLTKRGKNIGTPGNFLKADLRKAQPDLSAQIGALAARLEVARPAYLAVLARARSRVLHRFAHIWIPQLKARKVSLSLLDFDDQIERARHLLADPSVAAWVLWKLDGGLDHILVDEAQDTSPAQWAVIRSISEEFFAGTGARDVSRTVFVVGDEKQSIYSFQGADSEAFGRMRNHYSEMFDQMGLQLQNCNLIHSFRSAPPILDAVDAVFAQGPSMGQTAPIRHQAFFDQRPGRVELWPFLEKPDKAEMPPWYSTELSSSAEDVIRILAEKIAAEISGWLLTRRELPGTDRAIRAGDIMILVQSRNKIFHAVIKALKSAGVPVAGADKTEIRTDLAVQDLLAALRVAAVGQDDLSLACVLRSPLGGISESELFDLAHGRETNLWAALRGREGTPWDAPRALISDLRGMADFERPFELLQRILVRHDGRRKLIARLGQECEDGIEALLAQALAFETTGPPTLTRFLDWIDADKVDVKRRVDEEADLVRVMTVHGAKGLEKPIVILPDTAWHKEGHTPQMLKTLSGLSIWKPPSGMRPDFVNDAETTRQVARLAENMRLLYVAMTRAGTWLIVCGAGEINKSNPGWHEIIKRAIAQMPGISGDAETGYALSHNWEPVYLDPGGEKTAASPAVAHNILKPVVMDMPTATEATLSPSQLGGAHALSREPINEAHDMDVLARGELIHLILETLGDQPEARWPALLQNLQASSSHDLTPLTDEATKVLRRPELRDVFGPDTLAEVAFSAHLDALSGRRASGRIDRLIIRETEVIAVDFKSNRAVPETPEETPEGILRQLGAYRAALVQIWPGFDVETAILWTRDARLMPIPTALIEDALGRAALDIQDMDKST